MPRFARAAGLAEECVVQAERDLKGARAYGLGAKTFYDNIEPATEDGKVGDGTNNRGRRIADRRRAEEAADHRPDVGPRPLRSRAHQHRQGTREKRADPRRPLQQTKLMLAEAPADQETRLCVVGEKVRSLRVPREYRLQARGSLARVVRDKFLVSGAEIGRAPPTFEDASIIAQAIMESGYEFEKVSGA